MDNDHALAASDRQCRRRTDEAVRPPGKCPVVAAWTKSTRPSWTPEPSLVYSLGRKVGGEMPLGLR
jgi:hypothetical protein